MVNKKMMVYAIALLFVGTQYKDMQGGFTAMSANGERSLIVYAKDSGGDNPIAWTLLDKDGEVVKTGREKNTVTAVAMSADGSRFFLGNTMYGWSLYNKNGELVKSSQVYMHSIPNAVISADGKRTLIDTYGGSWLLIDQNGKKVANKTTME